ncbi:hypothetical protein [Actinomadura parmotrematis]|uniref:Uncharacterized protein n=1 Tax=Actinomadura parmotrematis TaxID=2864039 RepID=A0ABS7G0S7_9ACTN|nr:hypothetical protein [Actinomadura parmotrematis]MBW8486313.1 hypothetical protein [Actinomadura parmotrematis]
MMTKSQRSWTAACSGVSVISLCPQPAPLGLKPGAPASGGSGHGAHGGTALLGTFLGKGDLRGTWRLRGGMPVEQLSEDAQGRSAIAETGDGAIAHVPATTNAYEPADMALAHVRESGPYPWWQPV